MRNWWAQLIKCSQELVIQPLRRLIERCGILRCGIRGLSTVGLGVLAGIGAALAVNHCQTRGDLGLCETGMIVSSGQSCSLLTEHSPFRVVDDIAVTPWNTSDYAADPNREQIKVDPGAGASHTFQAEQLEDGSWHLLVVGRWESIGPCADDITLRLGEQCIEETTGDPFRVYATDEFNITDHDSRKNCTPDPDSCRPFHHIGYGVFYHFPGDRDSPNHIPSAKNWRLDDDRVLIYPANSDTCDKMPPLLAVRQSDATSQLRNDQWKIRELDRDNAGTMKILTRADHPCAEAQARKNIYIYDSNWPDIAAIRAFLASKLFKGKPTMHNANTWRGQPLTQQDGCKKHGYPDGYSGWAVRTLPTDDPDTEVPDPFFALSAGIVIKAGGDAWNTIAIYNIILKHTTFYLHAEYVIVKKNQFIAVGEKLGVQGRKGLDKEVPEHIHIEVHEGKQITGTCEASKTIDPLAYFYRQLSKQETETNFHM